MSLFEEPYALTVHVRVSEGLKQATVWAYSENPFQHELCLQHELGSLARAFGQLRADKLSLELAARIPGVRRIPMRGPACFNCRGVF